MRGILNGSLPSSGLITVRLARTQAQTVLLDGMHVRRAADQRHKMAGAREHGALETTDGSGADYGDRVEALGTNPRAAE